MAVTREEHLATADVECERVETYWDEDDGTPLDPEAVEAGIEREKQLMASLEVADRVHRDHVPYGAKIWTGRWCHRKRKGELAQTEAVRSRYVIRQFSGEAEADSFSGTPG